MNKNFQTDFSDIEQSELNSKNAQFWNELCGTMLAKSIGIVNFSQENLQRFDQEYFNFYPYLHNYFINEDLKDKRVLEVGLGFGSLGQAIAERTCHYHGMDIAWGPLQMIHFRLSHLQSYKAPNIQMGSALDIPYKDSIFDYYYSIGCLHHTGNLERTISEAHRVLKSHGKAIIMLYNKFSFRLMILVPLLRFFSMFIKQFRNKSIAERLRAFYDTSTKGETAPHTDFTSPFEVKRLFKNFSDVKIDVQNFDNISFRGKTLIKRKYLLNNIARILGLDLYVTATK